MDKLGATLFCQLTEANAAAAEHIRLGRKQLAREVNAIIGTLSVHKPPMQIINELIALCRREA